MSATVTSAGTATVAPTRPMTARSVVLSLLLGADEHGLASRDVVMIAGEFGVAPATTRVALSRLVSAGDLTVAESVYRLTPRHRRRQERQEASLHPRLTPYDGTWTTLVITGTGRGAAERAERRRELAERRFAELREGVWMRPDNLPADPPGIAGDAGLLVLPTRPTDDRDLAARLWDTGAWSSTGHALLAAARSGASLRERFEASAAIVRHLREDPWLPAEVLPADWPGDALRDTYEEFRAELTRLHATIPPSVPQQPKGRPDPASVP
ncbi:PaaX family transcriptional regulator C-terminal domain-containing protein [Aeromicrobium sp. CTD01-1L150]|uniref:PaaX family transcriptional regulator C-terminal domain-containing protein n=1 Tax=Aeromicrobium sp. CTD01-1L150 TaxID=3341830 RepID=UPI0035C15F22